MRAALLAIPLLCAPGLARGADAFIQDDLPTAQAYCAWTVAWRRDSCINAMRPLLRAAQQAQSDFFVNRADAVIVHQACDDMPVDRQQTCVAAMLQEMPAARRQNIVGALDSLPALTTGSDDPPGPSPGEIAWARSEALRAAVARDADAISKQCQLTNPKQSLRRVDDCIASAIAELPGMEQVDANEELLKRAAAARLARTEAACKRAGFKAGSVTIGMTQRQVLDCGWGMPESINKTITARRVSEQWVYSGSYLYFENGVLTTIQD